MDEAQDKDANMITVTGTCKRCHAEFEKELPKYFVEICEKAGAEGYTGTCADCAETDPIFRALHPQLHDCMQMCGRAGGELLSARVQAVRHLL
jgi:hypothetical protein